MKEAVEIKPPVLAGKLLNIFIRAGNRQYLLGDLEEYYNKILKARGKVMPCYGSGIKP